MLRNFKSLLNLTISSRFSNPLRFRPTFSFASPKYSLKNKLRAERIQTSDKKRAKNFKNWQVGMYGFVVACCFGALPLYRVFCEHVGLLGNIDKKTYEFDGKQVPNLRKYTVKFEGYPEPGINWQFEPIEKQVIVSPAQTAIVFYRLRNKENRPIVGFSTYNIYPEQVNIYFSKIQCFCFNQQMINPDEQLILPLFFYLEPELNDDPDIGRVNQIRVNYQFYQSIDQDLAKFAQDELDRIQENKRKLNEIRAKKQNMSLEKYEEMLEEKQYQEQLEVANIPLDRPDPPLRKIVKWRNQEGSQKQNPEAEQKSAAASAV